MLSIDYAQNALKWMFGDDFIIGAPQPFVRAYDNTNPQASPDFFNSLLRPEVEFPVSGNFGTPDVEALNLSSDYPLVGSTWVATSFVTSSITTATWTGTAITTDDVVIIVNLLLARFSGVLTVGANAYVISGTINPPTALGIVINEASIAVPTLDSIFYGNISYSLYTDPTFIGAIQDQIMCTGFFDLEETQEFISLNTLLGLPDPAGPLPPGIASGQGTINGVLVQTIFFAGFVSLSFEGYIFKIKSIKP